MKRFLILLAIFGLINPVYAFGKYKSQVEAKAACDKWAKKGRLTGVSGICQILFS